MTQKEINDKILEEFHRPCSFSEDYSKTDKGMNPQFPKLMPFLTHVDTIFYEDRVRIQGVLDCKFFGNNWEKLDAEFSNYKEGRVNINMTVVKTVSNFVEL